jgi:hypothetical protein
VGLVRSVAPKLRLLRLLPLDRHLLRPYPPAGPATPPVPPVGPATPPVPPVAPPAPATVVNTRTVTVGGGPALLVTLSNGQVLALPASATQADIDAAVRQYNSAQKQIIPPAGPSVPPTQAPPAVPPVQTAPTPGLTAQEEADVEAELQTGTPVEQTQALLRSLLGPRLRPNMYKKLETLGVGPDDPVVLSELEAYIPVYQRNKNLWTLIRGYPTGFVGISTKQEPDKLRRLQVVKPKQPRQRKALNLRQVWKRSLQPRPSLSLNQLSRTDVELAFQIIHRLQKQKPSKPQPHHLPPNLERLSPDQWAELWHLLLQLQAEQRHSPVH